MNINRPILQSRVLCGQRRASALAEFRWLWMSPGAWGASLAATLLLALMLFPLYDGVSLWVGVGLFIATIALINMTFAARHMFPFPQLAVLIACIQLILAAWGNWYYPCHHPIYDIQDRLPEYLSYAGPLCLLFGFGIILPIIGTENRIVNLVKSPGSMANKDQLAKELDIILVIGVSASILQRIMFSSLQFLFVLLANLSYVAVFAYMLLNIRGWKLRAGLVFTLLFLTSLFGGMFHDFVIWNAFFLFILAYCRQWSRRQVILGITCGLILVLLILSIKERYREQFWYGKTHIADSRAVAFSKLIIVTSSNPDQIFSPSKLSETLMRLNQGWIVNRALIWTPKEQPYARGKTLSKNFFEALVPRFLNPLKGEVGGRKDFERYTGVPLFRSSMELGFAGEMYVNFGFWAGLVGVGLYALILGMGFRFFYLRALQQPVLWAWIPYFAIVAVRAEISVGYLANWVLKAAIVMVCIAWLCPAMRDLMLKSAKGKEHSAWEKRRTAPSSKTNLPKNKPPFTGWKVPRLNTSLSKRGLRLTKPSSK